MPQPTDVRQALAEGARRSREASALRPGDTDLSGRDREALTPEVLWRRFKWPIIGAGMFLLIELLSMGTLGNIMGRHF